MRRQERLRRALTLHAWQAGNYQGVKFEKIEPLLGPAAAARAPAPTRRAEDLMLVMSRWRVEMAEQALRKPTQAAKPRMRNVTPGR